MGNFVDKVDIEAVLKGIGVKKVVKTDPLNLKESVANCKRMRRYQRR